MQNKENKETEEKKKKKSVERKDKRNRNKLPISFAANTDMNTKLPLLI